MSVFQAESWKEQYFKDRLSNLPVVQHSLHVGDPKQERRNIPTHHLVVFLEGP